MLRQHKSIRLVTSGLLSTIRLTCVYEYISVSNVGRYFNDYNSTINITTT